MIRKLILLVVVVTAMVFVNVATAGIAPTFTQPPGTAPMAEPANAVVPQGSDCHAVQDAVNAAAGTAAVWLDQTYTCDQTLNLPSNTTIEGSGPNAVLKFDWTDDSKGNYYLGTLGAQNITLKNFVVQGATDGSPSGPNSLYPNGLTLGIDLRNTDGFTIAHVEVRDVPGAAIHFQGDHEGVIEDNFVHDDGRGGIIGYWQRPNLYDVAITDNLVERMGDDAIAIWGTLPQGSPQNHSAIPYNITVTGNTIIGWPTNVNGRAMGHGIVMEAVHDVVISDNSITDTFASGLRVFGCSSVWCPKGVYDPSTGKAWRSYNVEAMDNQINDAGQLFNGSTVIPLIGVETHYGEFFDGVDNLLASDNIVTDSLWASLDVVDCPNAEVS